MKEILDDQLAQQEIDIDKINFPGAMAGVKWKYKNFRDRVGQTRAIIFGLSGLVFVAFLLDTIAVETFSGFYFGYTVFFSIIFFLCGWFFYRYTYFVIAVAAFFLTLKFVAYLSFVDGFSIRRIAVNVALIGFLIAGFYYVYKEREIKKDILKYLEEGGEIISSKTK